MNTRTKLSPAGASGVLAAGLASAVAALFTSRFGVAGTVLGAALTTMIITGGSSVLGLYLEAAAERARAAPDKLRVKSARTRGFQRPVDAAADSTPDSSSPSTSFRRYSPARGRARIAGALLAGLASFVIAASAVTALEAGAGQSLSCWVWKECPTTASAGQAGTLPSVLGGGPYSASGPQTPPPAVPEATEPSSASQYELETLPTGETTALLPPESTLTTMDTTSQ